MDSEDAADTLKSYVEEKEFFYINTDMKKNVDMYLQQSELRQQFYLSDATIDSYHIGLPKINERPRK